MRTGIIAGPHYPIPPPKYGGAELIIHYLIRGLQKAGHEPVLFGPGDSKVNCEVVPTANKAIGFPRSHSQLQSHNKLWHKINAATEEKLRAYLPRLDIIHSHGFDLMRFQDFPNLTTMHNAVSFENLSYYLERKTLYYTSISKNQQGACPDLQYVGVVYNGEDPEEFPIVDEPKDYVCFLGRLDDDKKPHLAIELAINLGMKIKLAGKVDFHGIDYFEQKIEPYLKHPLVEYLGELGFKEKIELLAYAKCNLHPTSFREPFGLSVLEAAYCGTPTLAIARGSMPELIEVERTGMLVEDFVEGFHQIQKCFEMNRRYIAQRAEMLFNYKTMTQQYITAYEKIIGIFTTPKDQEVVVRSMATDAKQRLEQIWDENKNQLSKTDRARD